MTETLHEVIEVRIPNGPYLQPASDYPDLLTVRDGVAHVFQYSQIDDIYVWRSRGRSYVLGVVYKGEMICWSWSDTGEYEGVGFVAEQCVCAVCSALRDISARKELLPIKFPNRVPRGGDQRGPMMVTWRQGAVAES